MRGPTIDLTLQPRSLYDPYSSGRNNGCHAQWQRMLPSAFGKPRWARLPEPPETRSGRPEISTGGASEGPFHPAVAMPRHDDEWPCHGAAPPCYGIEPSRHGVELPCHGVASSRYGVEPPHHGITSQRHGIAPPCHGIASSRHDDEPPCHGVATSRHGTEPPHQAMPPPYDGSAAACPSGLGPWLTRLLGLGQGCEAMGLEAPG